MIRVKRCLGLGSALLVGVDIVVVLLGPGITNSWGGEGGSMEMSDQLSGFSRQHILASDYDALFQG